MRYNEYAGKGNCSAGQSHELFPILEGEEIVGSCSPSPEEDEPPLLTWDRSACKMLDYEINGDRITIRYTVRIVSNTPDADWRLSNFTLYFAPEAVSGWFQYKQYYLCALESGESSVVIPRGECVDVILVLEAERFPDDAPQDPPMFSNMRYMMGIED